MNKSRLIKRKKEIVELLVAQSVSINAKSRRLETPDGAAPFSNDAVATPWPASGANVDATRGTLPLSILAAAHAGKKDTIEALLAQKANIEAKDSNGNTALSWAVSYGHAEIVKLLLTHGADANAKNNFDVSPLDLAVSFGNMGIAEILLAAGAEHGDTRARPSKLFSLFPGLPVRSYLINWYGRNTADFPRAQ